MRLQHLRDLLIGIAAISLASCGGGGGGGVSSTPFVPTPTPTPTPTPPPSGSLEIFPSVSGSTAFATLGYDLPKSGGATAAGFSVHYDASTSEYIFDLPSSQPGSPEVYQTGDRYWNAVLGGEPAGSDSINLNIFRPGDQNWDFSGLQYTSFAEYNSAGGAGEVAFGLPTSETAIPVTGSATYQAFVAAVSDADYPIRGSAELDFNFAGGTLSGHFDPVIYDLLAGNTSLGHYDFVNTVYGVGSTTFSGQLSSPTVTGIGSFDGLFTGPQAQELMAHFSAPFLDPYSNTQMQMFGVWVGKKGP